LLNNKALTCDNLQKRNKHGLGRCSLGKASDESNYHLIMSCSYSVQVWKELEVLTGLQDSWHGTSIEESLKVWCENVNTKKFRALPVIVAWGTWIARNYSLFDDKVIPSLQSAVQGF
jgi:hypothetical protein